MTRGSRADFPSTGASWIDYSPPEKGWAYWEDESRFGPISDAARREILRGRHYFREALADRERTPRRDLKQLKRDLKKAKKTGTFADKALERFVTDHTKDFEFFNPDAGIPEKIVYLLEEIEADPSGFMMTGTKPEIKHTIEFFYLFSRLGLDVSRGSAADLNAMTDKREAPATPFVEFVGRTIWGVSEDKPIPASLAQNIQKIIVRRSEYECGD